MMYNRCTGICKFGNNTYPRRIRRRSNLGHIFWEKKCVLWAGKYGKSSCKVPAILVRYSLNLNFLDRFFEESSNVKFHENPFSWDTSFPMRTDRQTDKIEANSRFSRFCKRVWKLFVGENSFSCHSLHYSPLINLDTCYCCWAYIVVMYIPCIFIVYCLLLVAYCLYQQMHTCTLNIK
jgi:hypothetical protein